MIHAKLHLALATFLLAGCVCAQGQSTSVQTLPTVRLPNLAVMRLESSRLDTADLDVLRDALTVELQNSGRVRVMERSQMNAILAEQGFQKTGSCDASECAVEVGRILAVDRMVLGSAGKLGETWSVTLRLVNVETGEVAASVRDSRSGTIEVLLSQSIPKLATALVAAIGTPQTAASQDGDFAKAALLVRDRAYRNDSGAARLQFLSPRLSEGQVLQLYTTGTMNRSWAWANLYPPIPIGTVIQNDWRGLGWIALGWSPAVLASVAGADNTGIFILMGWGFQIARPIWYANHNNKRLGQALNLGSTTWLPTPSLRLLASGTPAPNLTWIF